MAKKKKCPKCNAKTLKFCIIQQNIRLNKSGVSEENIRRYVEGKEVEDEDEC